MIIGLPGLQFHKASQCLEWALFAMAKDISAEGMVRILPIINHSGNTILILINGPHGKISLPESVLQDVLFLLVTKVMWAVVTTVLIFIRIFISTTL